MSTSVLSSRAFRPQSRAVSLVGWVVGGLKQLASGLAGWFTSGQEPRNAAQLLALAESVEATQPSWAADLRAVVMHLEAAEAEAKAKRVSRR